MLLGSPTCPAMSPPSCVRTAELAPTTPFQSPAVDRSTACCWPRPSIPPRSCRLPQFRRAASALQLAVGSSLARPSRPRLPSSPVIESASANRSPVPQLFAPRHFRSTLTTFRYESRFENDPLRFQWVVAHFPGRVFKTDPVGGGMNYSEHQRDSWWWQ